MSLKIGDVMVRDVISANESITVKQAVDLMSDHEIGCLIATKGKKPTGIVTERDLVRKVLGEAKNPKTTTVRDVMSTPLIIVEPQMELEQAVSLMVKEKIKKLPVTQDDKLVGMVTLTDILRFQPQILSLYKILTSDVTKKMH
jgi:CBS domain-containing protein